MKIYNILSHCFGGVGIFRHFTNSDECNNYFMNDIATMQPFICCFKCKKRLLRSDARM